MTEVRATFRVTTPMFCGGAEQKPELRAPSFKGVLRFWWRACAWSRLNGDLPRIRAEEEQTFGGPDAGQSSVRIRLTGNPAVPRPGPLRDNRLGLRYLGFGLEELDGSRARECLPAGFEVVARIRAPRLDASQIHTVVDAIQVLGLLGGMGARSRRGYGSLSLSSVCVDDEWLEVPATTDGLRAALSALARGQVTALPEYTALSASGRHTMLAYGNAGATEVLNQLGTELAEFRSGKRGGNRSAGFRDDRTVARLGEPPGAYPKRVAFGLPLNFGKGQPVVEPANHRRRGSPLFFHVHECGQQAVAVVSFLPARFLPGDKPEVSLGGRKRRLNVDSLYQPVTDFLDYLERNSRFTPIGEERR